MKVKWTLAALADLRANVPADMRSHLREHMQNMVFVGQGRRCTSHRYPDAHFKKCRHWLVMYVPLEADTIGVIGIEYNLGQEI